MRNPLKYTYIVTVSDFGMSLEQKSTELHSSIGAALLLLSSAILLAVMI